MLVSCRTCRLSPFVHHLSSSFFTIKAGICLSHERQCTNVFQKFNLHLNMAMLNPPKT